MAASINWWDVGFFADVAVTLVCSAWLAWKRRLILAAVSIALIGAIPLALQMTTDDDAPGFAILYFGDVLPLAGTVLVAGLAMAAWRFLARRR